MVKKVSIFKKIGVYEDKLFFKFFPNFVSTPLYLILKNLHLKQMYGLGKERGNIFKGEVKKNEKIVMRGKFE